MPSDIRSIAVCACVGCGRTPTDGVTLKRLNNYSRSFSCAECFVLHQACGNCGHERHPSADRQAVRGFDILANPLAIAKALGGCLQCGCTTYAHGLEREFDRQFEAHVGKTPTQSVCCHCGKSFTSLTLTNRNRLVVCDECDEEWGRIQGGSPGGSDAR